MEYYIINDTKNSLGLKIIADIILFNEYYIVTAASIHCHTSTNYYSFKY